MRLQNLFTFIIVFGLFSFIMLNIFKPTITGFVSFTSNPSISAGDATTLDDLVCSWSQSSDTTNITVEWYNGSQLFSNTTGNISEVTSPQTLSHTHTKKGETWKCIVHLYNGTDSTSSQANITINNSDPSIPIIYYNNTNIGTSMNLEEDSSYILFFNSTDADNDVLTYYLDSETFCHVLNATNGKTNCSPTHSDLDLSGNTELTTNKDVIFHAKEKYTDTGSIAYKTVTFSLIPRNDPVEMSLVSYQSSITVDDIYEQSFDFTDEENDDQNFSIKAINNNDSSELSYIHINSSTKKITFNTTDGTALITDYGNYTITITAVDAHNSSVNSTLSYQLEIISTNHAPALSEISSITGVQGQPLTITFNATDIDLNESLTFTVDPSSLYSFTSSWNYSVNGNNTWFANLTVLNLTNDHVINHQLTIYVTDKANAQDSYTVSAQFNNTNDPPIIYNTSNSSQNFLRNINYNISNLTAYIGSEFTYKINASDIDSLTYESENLYYSINTTDSKFNISSNGLFSFYSNQSSDIGTYNILVTVHDDGTSNYISGQNLSDNKTLVLHVYNNTAPYFVNISNTICYEDSYCFINITGNDSDSGDSVNYAIRNITLLAYGNQTINISINSTTGIINFTPLQKDVGNYSIYINLSDQRGAITYDYFNLTVINVNDAPVLTAPDSFPGNIVENTPYTYSEISATDEDLNKAYYNESLFFSSNLTPNVSGLFIINNQTGFVTINTSKSNCAGSYNVTIIVKDRLNAYDSKNISFTILTQGSPPQINKIYPYKNSTNELNLSWFDTPLPHRNGNISILTYENRTIIFNHSTTDPDGDNLTYNWYINGASANSSQLIENNHTLNLSFNFFSNNTYAIVLNIVDSRYQESNWTWNLTVRDLNRPPVLMNPLRNFTGSRSVVSVTENNYFTLYNSNPRFYDPDYDTNGNGKIDYDTETSGLTYNHTSGCDDYVQIIYSDDDSLTLYGLKKGQCSIFFTAKDYANLSATSNEVFINVTSKYETPVASTSSGGGGGSSSTVTVPVTIPIDNDIPKPLTIITPKSVVIYQNSTMVVPVEIKNNWTSPLENIQLNVSSTETKTEFYLSKNFIDNIAVGESTFLNLTIYNYREPGTYEISLNADVANPSFQDTAVIVVNSLENKNEGESLETKLSFARDLLNSNKECKELDEFLNKAQDYINSGNEDSATKMLDAAINGCKYLISYKMPVNDKKNSLNIVLTHDFLKDIFKNKKILFIVLVSVLILTGLTILNKKIKQKKEQKLEQLDQLNSQSNKATQ